MLYAKINKPSERVILHLQTIRPYEWPSKSGDVWTPLANAAEVAAFIHIHPEIEAVMFYDSRFPQRAVDVAKVTEKYLAKAFR